MQQGIPLNDRRGLSIRSLLVRIGILLVVPSVFCLMLAMAGLVRADVFAVGGIGGLRMIAAVAVLGCLMAAVGYWDDYERS
jgi:hypothetical protein